MTNVVVVGKMGQVAQELRATSLVNYNVTFLGRNDVDITDENALFEVISCYQPSFIINASAYTAVDKAQSEEEAAFQINELGVANLAKVAKKLTAQFIHISTDFVFGNSQNKPYGLNDILSPINVYGESKRSGENQIESIYAEGSSIIRTSWVYSGYANNFVKTMLKLMDDKDELGIVADQVGSPTYAKGLAQFIWSLTTKERRNKLYHYSDLGVASWYDFAIAIQEIAVDLKLLSKAIVVKPIISEQYPMPAKRPNYSVLGENSGDKHWRQQLKSMLTTYKNGY